MKTTKKFLAFVLCVCMVLSLMPAMQAQAAAAAAGLDESFEDCAAGAQPEGWSITSMKADSTIDTENDWAANYTLAAVSGEGVDGGTAVSLTKNSVGYAALTSAPVQAQSGTAYRLSYAYKTTALEGLQAAADFYGIHTVVACLDADGNLLTDGWLLMNDTATGFGQTLSEGWETVQHDFVAVEGTASIRVYLGIGGIYYIKATVLFDDISVTAYDAEEIANGDMEAVVYEVNGGRGSEIAGPSLWQTVSVNGNGELGDTNNWQNNYVVSTVSENGNSVLKIAPKDSTRGYAVALSNFMAVEPGENYLFTYDQKLENAENEPNWGIRAYVYFFDADQNVLTDATLLQTAKTGVSQDWTARELQFSAPDGAAYLKVGFYIGGVWNASSNFAYYYDDVQVQKAGLNSGFEVYTANNVLLNWSKTSVQANSTIETANDWAANYTLVAAPGQGVNGSTAASLTKNGVGYTALTSVPVTAQGGMAYRLSYTYKTTSLENLQAASDFYGIHAVVACLDADGNILTDGWMILNNTSVGKGQTVSNGWETVSHDFVAAAGTASVQVYLCMGGIYYAKATVLFDEVAVTAYDAVAIVNADFEGTVNAQLGGRTVEVEGPSAWSAMTTDAGGTWNSAGTNTYVNNYIVSTVAEADGNKVMKLAPKTSTMGYAVAYSNYIAVEANTQYTLSYDQKIDLGESALQGAKIKFYYFDADKNYLGEDWQRSSTEAHDWQRMENTFTTRNNAAYVIVGFFIGGTWGQNTGLAYYYDDLALEKVIPSYKVTYIADETTVAEYTVESGSDVPAVPEVPAKEGYTGAWDKDGTNITSDTTITAVYTKIAAVEKWNLSLGDDIGMNFYIDATEEQAANAVVELTAAGKTAAYDLSDFKDEDSGKYIVKTDMAAAQMTEQISLKLTVDGETVQTGTYSIYSYAQYVLADENDEFDEKTETLVREMLNYGAAAQSYFQYDAEVISSELISNAGALEIDVAAAPAMGFEGTVPNAACYGMSLVFEAKTAVRFYFTELGDISSCTFKVGETELTPVEKSGKWYVEIADIAPQDLNDAIVLTVTDGTDTVTVTYAPMNYMVRMGVNGSDGLKALLKAMYNYHLAAVDYVSQDAA